MAQYNSIKNEKPKAVSPCTEPAAEGFSFLKGWQNEDNQINKSN